MLPHAAVPGQVGPPSAMGPALKPVRYAALRPGSCRICNLGLAMSRYQHLSTTTCDKSLIKFGFFGSTCYELWIIYYTSVQFTSAIHATSCSLMFHCIGQLKSILSSGHIRTAQAPTTARTVTLMVDGCSPKQLGKCIFFSWPSKLI